MGRGVRFEAEAGLGTNLWILKQASNNMPQAQLMCPPRRPPDKQSTCELELDVCVEDIINRHEVRSRHRILDATHILCIIGHFFRGQGGGALHPPCRYMM